MSDDHLSDDDLSDDDDVAADDVDDDDVDEEDPDVEDEVFDLTQPPGVTPEVAEPPVGELQIIGRLVRASNATFLVADESGRKWVYKPIRGEAPLRDFPTGTLGHREIAAHDLSRAAGFGCVPFTCRADGPFGPGSVQHWVDDAVEDLVDLVAPDRVESGWFGIVIGADADDNDVALVHADHPHLRRLAVFDVIANNADRKGGHILHRRLTDPAASHVLGADHGLTFNADHKLRTVLWGWAGEPFTDDERALLTRALEVSEDVLSPWLDDEELQATHDRIVEALERGTFPEPIGEGWRVIPWPPI